MIRRRLIKRHPQEFFKRDPVVDLSFQFGIGVDTEPLLQEKAFTTARAATIAERMIKVRMSNLSLNRHGAGPESERREPTSTRSHHQRSGARYQTFRRGQSFF